MQDVVLMEVVHALADLLGEQDHVQFGQVVLVVCDPVKEFAAVHAAKAKGGRHCPERGSQRRRPRSASARSHNRLAQGSARVPLPSGVSRGTFTLATPSSACRS